MPAQHRSTVDRPTLSSQLGRLRAPGLAAAAALLAPVLITSSAAYAAVPARTPSSTQSTASASSAVSAAAALAAQATALQASVATVPATSVDVHAPSSRAVTQTIARPLVVPKPKEPTGLPSAIEPLADYVGQDSCTPMYRRGTLALGRLLVATYPNTSFGGAYACGTDGGQSEHYDGRAIDWMNSVRDARQKAQAAAVLSFLLGTDSHGNRFANARRMGVMYVIWNNNIWGAWDGKWAPYNNCAKTPQPSYDSSCHRNHMHISLSWAGALGRTSFWSKRLYAATDYGPCRPKDLNWAPGYTGTNLRGCTWYSAVAAPRGSSSVMVGLVKYSGVIMSPGFAGPPIAAIQAALRVPITSVEDAATVTMLNRFKVSRHLARNGVVDQSTWRALLYLFRPKR